MKKFLFLSIVCSIVIACTSKPSESFKEEDPIANSMIEAIDMLYSGNIAEDDVVSFIDDLRQVLGDEDDWAPLGYWRYSDGHFHTYTIDECVPDGEYGPYAIMTLTDTPQPVQIRIEMNQNGDKWIINDICGIENDNISYAFSDYITVAIAESEPHPNGEY